MTPRTVPSAAINAARADPRTDADLIRAAQAGSVEARNLLVVRHFPLITTVSRRLVGPDRAPDFYSYAVEAFIKAIMRYDPTKADKLATYAVQSIYNWLRDYVRREASLILPKLGHDMQRVASLRKCLYAKKPASLNYEYESTFDGGRSMTLSPEARPIGPDPADVEHMRNAIAALSDRLREVLWMRTAGLSLAACRDQLGLSRARVHQLHVQALARLRELMEAA